ncbi:MAG: UDP-N-acetylglucosamine--N-acetylmuramyl-(pentapeptide) pyrophosphoryl-undecaprenol N-acetylglucosamine transferase [bacterium]
MNKLIIVISGIGTGGHYFPAAVVAKEFMKYNWETIFLVRPGFPEEAIAKEYDLKTFEINPRPYYGKSLINKIIALVKAVQSVIRLNTIMKKGVGISFGGFGSLPLILSCIINRRQFYLFEPNRIPGRTTRLFARRARKVFLGMPCGIKMRGDAIITGIPIREEFKQMGIKKTGTKTVLFLGGSQGAKKLNELAIELQTLLPQDYRIIIISGKRDFEWVNDKKDMRTEVISFTAKPWEIIQRADVVISRAGALSGYELMLMGKATVFIPFPFAVDNHQYYNAEYFAQMPNVKIVQERDLNVNLLSNIIVELMNVKKANGLMDKKFAQNAEKIIAETIIKDIL